MSEHFKITFGICTYNRKNIVSKSAASLAKVRGIENVTIKVYDDCSTEYNEDYLKAIFPKGTEIIRRISNGGADINTSEMYEDFLKGNDEWLFNADSDLIYRSDIIDAIQEYKDKSKGFMTLFNCINHHTIGESDYFYEKDSVGAAGCLLRRDVVELILKHIRYRVTGFDVGFSKLLRNKGYKLLATKQSFVQHIGVSGFNSRNINFDFGESYICDDRENGQIIEETFEEYIKRINRFREKFSWKAFYFITSIPRRIRKIFRILIIIIQKK